MSQSGLAVLVTIKQGKEDEFRSIINNLNDENPQISIDFEKGQRTYFARFVILDDPDQGADRKRLLFAAIFDGDLASYLEDLKNNTSDMQGFWGFCEDYKTEDSFQNFIESHNHEANTFLKAYGGETVGSLRKKLELLNNINKMFDVPPSEHKDALKQIPHHESADVSQNELTSIINSIIQFVPTKLLQLLRVVALLRYGTNLLYALYAVVWRGIKPEPIDKVYSEAPIKKGVDCRSFGEVDGIKDEVVAERPKHDAIAFLKRKRVQNEMTVVTVNNPHFINRQKAIMELINVGSAILNSGTRIPTIHFGRWIMIDNDCRMLFLSNYDGSWESYIGDFVDRANVPVDAFWSGSVGWRSAGSRDIDFFKEGILCHQTQASFYYSANRLATVTRINKAIEIAMNYEQNIDEKTAKQWLKSL